MNPIEETPLVRIVDDDASICASLSFMLRHEATRYRAGKMRKAFFAMTSRVAPGAWLLDIRMPKISGSNCSRFFASARSGRRLFSFRRTETLKRPFTR